MEEKPLWQLDEKRRDETNISQFTQFIETKLNRNFADYHELWRWSVENSGEFWSLFWDFADIIASHKGDRLLIDGDKMPGAQFFPDARLNFAENLLCRRDEKPALFFRSENKVERQLSWSELYDLTAKIAYALRQAGIKKGDVIAGFVPNMPETVAAMLATASIGAIWTSCSPDFGKQGVLDRFGQTKPKILFAADGYYYNGKAQNSIKSIASWCDDIPSLENIILWPLLTPDDEGEQTLPTKAIWLDEFIGQFDKVNEIEFTQIGFNDPLVIMYSSGTTGKPKCIIHRAGGVLLMQLKEHILHADVRPDDRVFYFTTCGWMMWNWLIAGLAAKASLVLYDGSPFYEDGYQLYDYADKVGVTLFGTSAKFIDACAKANIKPKDRYKLKSLRTVCSTGSPLMAEGFDYIYENVKQDICLSSISGGTDLLACFILGNPNLPVYRGYIQAPGLGMAVAVYDDDGKNLMGQRGELVCEKPFPSMPIGFWDDEDGKRYHEAYFAKYDNIWTHGDYILWDKDKGYQVFGRSDATLNPGGVRIGTAEIYRQVESFEEIYESIVIGQSWKQDTRVVLFVRLKEGGALDEALIKRIKTQIRQNCTPRHVPAKIIAIDDIPRTRSGKITELAVRDVVHGVAVKNQNALANPEALELYKDIPALQED